MKTDYIKGDVVQITDQEDAWFPCLIVVSELKSFGVQGYIVIPTNDKSEVNGQAYRRLRFEKIEWVGRVIIDTPDREDTG